MQGIQHATQIGAAGEPGWRLTALHMQECREISGANGRQLPSFPVEWRFVTCGSLVVGHIYMRLAPGGQAVFCSSAATNIFRHGMLRPEQLPPCPALPCHGLPCKPAASAHHVPADGGPYWQAATFGNSQEAVVGASINGEQLEYIPESNQ